MSSTQTCDSQHGGESRITAEVALLNKTAVALAADSAMTLGGSGKTYPAQKLFSLTDHHPVGVMIYNNAEFMGIPWESLIKMYRHSLGKALHGSIGEYAADFVRFIGRRPFSDQKRGLENVIRVAKAAFALVRNSPGVKAGSGGDDGLLLTVIEEHRAAMTRQGESPSMNGVDLAQVMDDCRAKLDELIDQSFGGDLATPLVRVELRGLVEDVIRSRVTTSGHSGVVIAGFGECEVFPTLVELTTDGVVAGTVKHDIRRTVDIARDGTSAEIVPFAQREMVTRFMEGVDPAFLEYLRDSMGEASRQLVMEVLKSMDVQCSEEDAAAVREAASKQADHYLKQAESVRHSKFVAPIMDIVEHLPKEELADMAEALVSLTALKRRVSREAETVGGPIDVAVVSKGDGLIWVKRKHYFDPALNPGYFRRRL